MRCSAYATGHHCTRGWPSGAEHCRRERLVRFQARQRVDAEPECVGRRRRPRRGSHPAPCAAAAPTWAATSLPIAGADAASSDQAERFGRAAGDERRRIGHGGAQRLDGRWIADQAERERRHLPHFGIRVGLQQPDERRHAFGQARRGRPRSPRGGECAPRRRSSSRIKSGGGGGGGSTLRLPCRGRRRHDRRRASRRMR